MIARNICVFEVIVYISRPKLDALIQRVIQSQPIATTPAHIKFSATSAMKSYILAPAIVSPVRHQENEVRIP